MLAKVSAKFLSELKCCSTICSHEWPVAHAIQAIGLFSYVELVLLNTQSLAKHCGCYFLNITASSIMSKWLGDANSSTLILTHIFFLHNTTHTEPGQALRLLLPEHHRQQHHVKMAGRCKPAVQGHLFTGEQAAAMHHLHR